MGFRSKLLLLLLSVDVLGLATALLVSLCGRDHGEARATAALSAALLVTSALALYLAQSVVWQVARLVAITDEMTRCAFRMSADLRERLAALASPWAGDAAALASFLQRVDGELTAASEVQLSLVPMSSLRHSERSAVELQAKLQPARGIGGDLYDFFWIDDRRFFFVIGDVSEKGVPAALIMAVTETLLKTHVAPHLELSDILAVVNDRLSENNAAQMFVTMFCGILDVESGKLKYCDGGHTPPYLLPCDAPPARLRKRNGMALGLSRGFRFQSEEAQLRPGDGIFLYTDGITEAMNDERELYSEVRLEQALGRAQGQPLRSVLDAVLSDVQLFRAGTPQSDDIAMLALRYRGPRERRCLSGPPDAGASGRAPASLPRVPWNQRNPSP